MLSVDQLRAALGRMADKEQEEYEVFAEIDADYEEAKLEMENEQAAQFFQEMTGRKVKDDVGVPVRHQQSQQPSKVVKPKDVEEEKQPKQAVEVKQADKSDKHEPEKQETKRVETKENKQEQKNSDDDNSDSDQDEWAGESKEYWLKKQAQLNARHKRPVAATQDASQKVTAQSTTQTSSTTLPSAETQNEVELKGKLVHVEGELLDLRQRLSNLESLFQQVLDKKDQQIKETEDRVRQQILSDIQRSKSQKRDQKIAKARSQISKYTQKLALLEKNNANHNKPSANPSTQPQQVVATTSSNQTRVAQDDSFDLGGFSIKEHGGEEVVFNNNNNNNNNNSSNNSNNSNNNNNNNYDPFVGSDGTLNFGGLRENKNEGAEEEEEEEKVSYFQRGPFEEVPASEWQLSAVDHLNKQLLESFKDVAKPQDYGEDEEKSHFTDADWED